ncbi:MAG: lytic murein transglycosylase [Solirubrobacteraceae bacterium]
MTSAFVVGQGLVATTASAKQRTFVITLLGNLKKTVTVDVGANVPVEQVRLPSVLGLPILNVREITPPAPAPAPLAPLAPPAAPAAPPPGTTNSQGEYESEEIDTPTIPDADDGRKDGSKKSRSTSKSAKNLLGSAGNGLDKIVDKVERKRPEKTDLRFGNGVPTAQNPTFSLALPGPLAVGVPSFFINKFRIPVFLLPIYQAAGIQYGVPWEVLAAINEIETNYGRNLNVSSAGAMGWMQFIPSSWKAYGVDANGDGKKDPYNPVDAIFAAARYLKAAGAENDLRKAVFAYNHADWYVDSVLMRARFIGGMPADLVGSLSGLTQGRFPVHAKAKYADDISEREASKRVARGENAANPVEGKAARRGINIYAKAGAPVVAVQDGKIVKVGNSKRLGNYVIMRDVYGNTYTYGGLKKVATKIAVPKERKQSKSSIAKELKLPKDDKPSKAASAGSNKGKTAKKKVDDVVKQTTEAVDDAASVAKERLFANPTRPKALKSGGKRQLQESESPLNGASVKRYFTGPIGLKSKDVVLKSLVPGRSVIAGTILGRIGKTSDVLAPHVLFEIRPAGRGAPRIDPQPILDGWKVLEATAIYRAQGKNPFFGEDAKQATVGQILLMSKETLIKRVLANPRIELYSCGRQDIQNGITNRRVLASLEFLAASGLKPTVTSLRCGHGFYTKGGRVSAHSSGNAVDIAKINGIPIMGNQGAGSITDIAVRRLLTLQGTMKPSQIITLMKYDGTDNTLAMGDHDDHIHLGFRPQIDADGKLAESILKPSQWVKLIDRLGQIDNPTVATAPSKYAIKADDGRASKAHEAE